jgi:small-conductance mechanosensitive channel
MLVTIALSVAIFGAGWSFWRNVFSGIVIKLSSQLKIGEAIDIEFAKGELKSIGMSQSELINESGETVVIPNYKLRNSVFRHLNKETHVQAHSFNVTVSAGKTIESVYRIALECPFVSANQKVEVERVGPNELVVRASVIDNAFIDNVNTYLHEYCGSAVTG